MAETIRGLNVVIGSDTVGLNKALGEVDKSARSIQSELRQVEKLLKFDPKNTELLSQKQKLLADAVATTKTRLDALKEAQSQVNEQFQRGEISEGKYRAFQREIAKTEQELKRLEGRAKTAGVSLEQIAKATERAAQRFNALGNTLLRTVAAPLLALGGAAYKMASDTEEAVNKVEVAFGDASRSVKAWAKTTLDSYGLAEGTALDAAALFGDMATAMGFSQTKAAEMSTTLVGLAADLASFKNIGIDQAQTALKAIFTGETESLKNLGIVMTQANLQAYALSKGINKTVQEMTQAEQVSLRYSYVMDMTRNAQGDFARTSDGAANSMRVFQESVKELSAEFGENLLPMITPVIKEVTNLVKTLGDLDEETQNNIITLGKWAIGVSVAVKGIGLLSASVSALVGKYKLATAWASTTAASTAALGSSAGAAATAVGLLAKATSFLLGPWGLIIGAGALALAIANVGDKSRDATNELRQAEHQAKMAANAYEGDLAPAMNEVAQAADGATEAVRRFDEQIAAAQRQGLGVGQRRAKDAKGLADALAAAKKASESPPSTGTGKTWLELVQERLRAFTLDADIAEGKLGLLRGAVTGSVADNELLTQELEYQRERLAAHARIVDALTEALDRMRREQGENSREAKELTLQLLQAQKAYQDVQREIDETNKRLKESSKVTKTAAEYYLGLYIQRQVAAGAMIESAVTEKLANLPGTVRVPPTTSMLPTAAPPPAQPPTPPLASAPITIQETVNIYGDASKEDVEKALDDSASKLVTKLRLAAPGVTP
jgi:septal ring factor EnvC (AmiA/AmiB activator)